MATECRGKAKTRSLKSMNPGFPQYALSAKQRNRGVGIVGRIVGEEFGWLFRENPQELDFGIDGQIAEGRR